MTEFRVPVEMMDFVMRLLQSGKITREEAHELLATDPAKVEERAIALLVGRGMRAVEMLFEGGAMSTKPPPQMGSMTFKEAQANLDPAIRRSAQRLVNAGKTPTVVIVSDIVRRLFKGGRRSYTVACKVGDGIKRFKLQIVVDPRLPGDLVVMDHAVKLTKAQRAELDAAEEP